MLHASVPVETRCSSLILVFGMYLFVAIHVLGLVELVQNCTWLNVQQQPLPDFSWGFNFSTSEQMSYNAHMKMIHSAYETLAHFVKHVSRRAAKHGLPQVSMLDVGGNSGKWYEMEMRRATNYTSLDFVATPPDHGRKELAPNIVGNIQWCNKHILPGTFTIITALNVFEHLLGPEAAAAEMIRMVANGGFLIVMVPFSWRYHAYPIDTARYTHTMIRYMFEKTNRVKTLFAAYAVDHPIRKGHYKDTSDEPPVDGLRNNMNVELLWIGQRMEGLLFDPESLDRNKDFNGPLSNALP